MPVYNGAVFMRETIDSLLAQTYRDFELIISDNASTDETQAICEQYAARDPRVRYIRQDVNRGLCWNWNHVFEVSRGSYFKWTACDDLYDSRFLECTVGILDSHPDVAWCHTLSIHIDTKGKPVVGEIKPEISHVNSVNGSDPRYCRTSSRPSQRIKAVLLGQNGLDCYGVIRSEVVRKTALLLPYFGAEKVLTAELALRGRYIEVPEILFFARIHEQAAGNLHSGSEQARLMSPGARKWSSTRLSLLRGYFAAIRRAELTRTERFWCYCAIGHYLLQVRKWKSVIKKALAGRGLTGDYPSVSTNNRKATD
jgi:glycosyltransferase involved in cell wall biosynthesis